MNPRREAFFVTRSDNDNDDGNSDDSITIVVLSSDTYLRTYVLGDPTMISEYLFEKESSLCEGGCICTKLIARDARNGNRKHGCSSRVVGDASCNYDLTNRASLQKLSYIS